MGGCRTVHQGGIYANKLEKGKENQPLSGKGEKAGEKAKGKEGGGKIEG